MKRKLYMVLAETPLSVAALWMQGMADRSYPCSAPECAGTGSTLFVVDAVVGACIGAQVSDAQVSDPLVVSTHYLLLSGCAEHAAGIVETAHLLGSKQSPFTCIEAELPDPADAECDA